MSKTNPEQFDAIIIGVGQSGKPLALALAEKGWNTAVVERNFVGGSCINYGCTPTKTLIASAQVAHQARRAAEYGIETGAVRVDFGAVMARKNRIVEAFRKKIEDTFAETNHLTFLGGEARFTGPKDVAVAFPTGEVRTLHADRIFIDCGTSPKKPELEGLDSVPWLTSASLMALTELPSHLLILGGGYIGLEFSQLFRRLGSEVTIIAREKQLLSREDPDIAAEVAKILQDEGIKIHLNTEVQRVSQDASGVVELHFKTGQKSGSVRGTHLLVAVGTTSATSALNLEAAGVKTDEKGFIRVNSRLETTQPGIYALGDCKGGPAFTHISYDDYRIIRQNLLEGGKASITGRAVPYTVFTEPQLGRIGLSEREAREQGKAIKIATMPMAWVGRAIETGQTEGLMKIILDAKTDRLLGAAILGMEGGEIMAMLQIAMMGKLTYPQLQEAIFAHPTLAESLNNVFAQIK